MTVVVLPPTPPSDVVQCLTWCRNHAGKSDTDWHFYYQRAWEPRFSFRDLEIAAEFKLRFG